MRKVVVAVMLQSWKMQPKVEKLSCRHSLTNENLRELGSTLSLEIKFAALMIDFKLTQFLPCLLNASLLQMHCTTTHFY